MDHYPEFNVSERECPREDWSSSRHDSASSIDKSTIQHSSLDNNNTNSDAHDSSALPQYTSFPPPSIHSETDQQHPRTDSVHDISDTEKSTKPLPIEAELARYMDAPPPYSEKQYEGKSEEEQSNMRKRDYARELSRMMGRQLVRGLRSEKAGSE